MVELVLPRALVIVNSFMCVGIGLHPTQSVSLSGWLAGICICSATPIVRIP